MYYLWELQQNLAHVMNKDAYVMQGYEIPLEMSFLFKRHTFTFFLHVKTCLRIKIDLRPYLTKLSAATIS